MSIDRRIVPIQTSSLTGGLTLTQPGDAGCHATLIGPEA